MFISVVIIAKNEAHIIAETVTSVMPLTDDILVADTGSTDDTIKVAKSSGARVIELKWEGFGLTKNKAVALAKYDWILSIDADEVVDMQLLCALQQLKPISSNEVYELNFRNFLGGTPLYYGVWGWDKHVRLFNRNQVCWNREFVHEKLILPGEVKINRVKGYILHKTAIDKQEYLSKMRVYANYNADRYFSKGKQRAAFKIWVSPVFDFIKNYIFRFGFLDGYNGFVVSRIHAYYTFLKYMQLKNLNKQGKKS